MKKGYVSIEVIIVAAVVIVGGLLGVVTFIRNGQDNQKQAVETMDNAISQAESGWTNTAQ